MLKDFPETDRGLYIKNMSDEKLAETGIENFVCELWKIKQFNLSNELLDVFSMSSLPHHFLDAHRASV